MMEKTQEERDKALRRANLRLAWALGIVAVGLMLLSMYNFSHHLP